MKVAFLFAAGEVFEMHIPDGFLDAKTWIAASGISAGTVTYALYAVRQKLDEKMIPLLGVVAAFIFAAQMLNFPVAGGTSGHFLGALMACILLGPWMGFLAMVLVLVIQALVFADGGLTALGANVFNMGIIAGLACYYMFYYFKALLAKKMAEKSAIMASSAIFAWISVVLASIYCALELAVSGTVPLHVVLPAMVGVHAIIGIGESIITTSVVSLVLATRPDLVYAYKGPKTTQEAPAKEAPPKPAAKT